MRRSLPVLAVLALVLAFAATALAKPVHSQLSLKINKKETLFKGALTSTRSSCLLGVEVTLYWQQKGTAGYEDVTSSHTNADGTFKFQPIGQAQLGKYYATTNKNGKCPATKSNTVKVVPIN